MRSGRTAAAVGVVLGSATVLGMAAAAAGTAPGAREHQADPAFDVVATTAVGQTPGRVTYGYGATWTPNAGEAAHRQRRALPSNLSIQSKVSPTSGLVPGAVSAGLDIGLTCTAAGAGAVWATQRPDSLGGTPALLFRLSQANLATVASATLPLGANPGPVQCPAVGGGLVYVTDGVGSPDTIRP